MKIVLIKMTPNQKIKMTMLLNKRTKRLERKEKRNNNFKIIESLSFKRKWNSRNITEVLFTLTVLLEFFTNWVLNWIEPLRICFGGGSWVWLIWLSIVDLATSNITKKLKNATLRFLNFTQSNKTKMLSTFSTLLASKTIKIKIYLNLWKDKPKIKK